MCNVFHANRGNCCNWVRNNAGEDFDWDLEVIIPHEAQLQVLDHNIKVICIEPRFVAMTVTRT